MGIGRRISASRVRLFGTGPRRFVAAVAIAVAVAACDDPFQVIEEVEFASSLGIDLAQMERLPSGVYIQDLVDGTGDTLKVGLQANVDYTGWLANGTEFGSGNFSFVAGDRESANSTILGFDLGTQGMLVGGTRRLIIPPDLGYGDADQQAIPPGSVLVFEVDLLTVEAGG